MSIPPLTLSSQSLSHQLAPYLAAPRWLVAYSGGVDSAVLLHLLNAVPGRPPLLAVHINHQLQTQADEWEHHCGEYAQQLGVEYYSEKVVIERERSPSLEQAARQARYRVFEKLLQPGELLLMGHHLDDQVETLLLRLLRGSGSSGLAAIPRSRHLGHGLLLRPLLEFSREDIEAYARQWALRWVDDPSNDSSVFDRNFLRREVLPLVAARWPGYRATLGRAAALSEEAAQLNRELAELDCHALSLSPLASSWPIPALLELSPGRCKNLLRFWLQSRQLALPSAAQMDTLLAEVVHARRDAEPLLEWPGVQVRRFRDELYAMQPLPAFDSESSYPLQPTRPAVVQGVGAVSLEPAVGEGIGARHLERGHVELRFRCGGERCRPRGRAGSQTLKKLMQEYAIETWLRDRVPLVYIEGELAAVADYWVCEGFAAEPGEHAYQCRWQRPW